MTLEPRLVRRAGESSLMNHFSVMCVRYKATAAGGELATTDTGVDAQSVPTECNGGSRDPKWLELTLCER